MGTIREDAKYIIRESIEAVMPQNAVKEALKDKDLSQGRVRLVSIGKAAWSMAKAADDILGDRIEAGLVVTKYDHSMGAIASYEIIEAGHPVPDENSFLSGKKAREFVDGLAEEDLVLFMISGGGSALFEDPAIPTEEITDITSQLLASGADIVEINTIRKRLSLVKGGQFALACHPAKVYCIILSDVIGDPPDMIASGPAHEDASSMQDALNIVNKYQLKLSDQAMKMVSRELPKDIDNVETIITGSVKALCQAAKKACEELGYQVDVLTDHLDCQAKEAGTFMADIALTNQDITQSKAWIAGGETVVVLKGDGKGGRNQELALSAADKIDGCQDTLVLSIGSDGTDGPTDAAGGMVDGQTKACLKEQGISIEEVLNRNDAYHALEKCDGLIITGPTGTNVNDVCITLIKRS